jgi:hypothetical protein
MNGEEAAVSATQTSSAASEQSIKQSPLFS